MNPFDLAGPEFLGLYVLIALSVHVTWGPIVGRLSDQHAIGERVQGPVEATALGPYLIAFLRGRTFELARVTVLSMLQRGHLRRVGDEIFADPTAGSSVTIPHERTLMKLFQSRRKARDIFGSTQFQNACFSIDMELQRLGLVPSYLGQVLVKLYLVCCVACVAGIAAAKILIAIERGHSNVGFLILSSIAASTILLFRARPTRTPLGEKILQSLAKQRAYMKEQVEAADPNSSDSAVLMLVAAFGLCALPREALAEAQVLFPLAAASPADSSSCGSSCGGGGCGGGCGGCGGCS